MLFFIVTFSLLAGFDAAVCLMFTLFCCYMRAYARLRAPMARVLMLMPCFTREARARFPIDV